MPDFDRVARLVQRRFEDHPGPIAVAVGGPGGTGKSVFSQRLANRLGGAVLPLDDYKQARIFRAERGVYGPHPLANKMELIGDHLRAIKEGRAFERPVYCSRIGDVGRLESYRPARFNIVDGEVSTYPDFEEWVDYTIYIDSDWKTQLMNRIVRDVEERGHTPAKVLNTFLNSNLREFPEYGEPTREKADVVLYSDSEHRLRMAAPAIPSTSGID